MSSRTALLAALPALVVGLGAGFFLATSLDAPDTVAASPTGITALDAAPTRSAGSSAALALVGDAPAERAPAEAASAPATPRVSEARLERALAAVDAPLVEERAGSGRIRGVVLDAGGAPLAGATVVARPGGRWSTSDPTRIGAGPPVEEELEEALRDHAESWARSRAGRRRATTDAVGAFELVNLDEAEQYDVSAYLEGFALSAEGSSRVSPGANLVFRAEAVHQITVRLAWPDGGSPESATVGVRRGDREQYYTWTAVAPFVRLTAGRVGLRAYAGDDRRVQRGIESTHASEERSLVVEAEAGAPLELVLAPRTGIRGRVVQEGSPLEQAFARLLPLPPGVELDEKALAGSGRQDWLIGDRFSFLDLEPGRWAVGLSSWTEVLYAHEVVTVASGIVDVDLVVAAPDPEESLALRAFGPGGEPLRDLDFGWSKERQRGSSSGGIQGVRDPDGTWWLKPAAEFFEPWPAETVFVLTVRHSELGSRRVELEEGQREVSVQFEEPVALRIVVEGYVGSGREGRLRVDVSELTEGGRRRGTRGGGIWFGPGQRDEGQLSAEGVARYDRLAPGLWHVSLQATGERFSATEIASTEVRLDAGETEVRLVMPDLSDLVVVAPGLSAESYLRLEPADEQGSGRALTERVDGEGRAVFRDLVAGRWTLSGQGITEPVEVVVPRGELHLDARDPDSLRVAIGDTEGALYKAGLRAGDLVVGVDGEEFASAPNAWDYLTGEGRVTLIVLRGNERLEIGFDRVASGGSAISRFGGMLTPTHR